MLVAAQRIAGALVLAAAVAWLRREEYAAVHTPSSTIVAADPARIDRALEGQRIAVRAAIATPGPISDGEFLQPGTYAAIFRTAYAFKTVTRHSAGPSHSYTTRGWDKLDGGIPPLDTRELVATPTRAGAYEFDAARTHFKRRTGLAPDLDRIAEKHAAGFMPAKGAFYLGASSYEEPALGDHLIYIDVVRAGAVVTLIGRQRGGAVVPDDDQRVDDRPKILAVEQTLAELQQSEIAALTPELWSTRFLAAYLAAAALFFLVAPRRSAPALATAIHWTLGLLLPYSFGLGVLIGPAMGLTGTPFIVAFAAGLVLFAWAMATIPSGPRPLR